MQTSFNYPMQSVMLSCSIKNLGRKNSSAAKKDRLDKPNLIEKGPKCTISAVP